MYRRGILSVVAATLLAGCGWSQETRSVDDATGPGANNGTQGNGESDETPEPLPESEAGETLIEREDEELLLPAAGFREWAQRDDWGEVDYQSTNACRKFQVEKFRETVRECEYCIIVAEDEDTATEEYQTFADISESKTPPRGRNNYLEEQDLDLEVGNEAVVHSASLETGQNEDKQLNTRSRIVFRDKNVVGTVDYHERTWGTTDIELRDARDLVDLAVRLHEFWREE